MLMFASALALSAPLAQADEYYKGKTITIINSTGSGDTYGLIARALARAMPKYLPGGPTMVVQDMPGGGNLVATNHLYNVAAKDGTVIGTINNAMPLFQILDGRGVRFDAGQFNWLGSPGYYNSVAMVWSTAGVTRVEDLYTKEVVLGGTGPGSSIVLFPTVMNNVLDTKFKIVNGYNSAADVSLAMERGEVQSRTGSYMDLLSQRPQWMSDKKVNIVVQIGPKPDKDLPDVPMLTDLAKNDEQRAILKLVASPISLGRPFLAPPGVPRDIVSMLRQSFAATMKDSGFQADMAKLNIPLDPISGEDIAASVREALQAPPAVIAKAKVAIGAGDTAKN
jgi:tripartite-type tricarboxylate transporter receptor subunit TctC